MAQRALDRQEYDDIRHWLAGKKSSAQGRIWRRPMPIQVHNKLPRIVRAGVSVLDAVPTDLLTTTFVLSTVISLMPQIFALFGMPLSLGDLPQPTTPMPGEMAMRALMPMIMSVMPIVSVGLGALYLLILGRLIFLAGD